MEIAIVSNEKVWLERMPFYSVERFLLMDTKFDLVFIDVASMCINEIHALERYREAHQQIPFILITTYMELVQNIGSVEKFQLVEIPLVNIEKLKICAYDIVFFEVYGHAVYMHLRQGSRFKCKESLSELACHLRKLGFVATSRSYLVNAEHIKTVELDKVILSNDSCIPLSRRKYPEIKQYTQTIK